MTNRLHARRPAPLSRLRRRPICLPCAEQPEPVSPLQAPPPPIALRREDLVERYGAEIGTITTAMSAIGVRPPSPGKALTLDPVHLPQLDAAMRDLSARTQFSRSEALTSARGESFAVELSEVREALLSREVSIKDIVVIGGLAHNTVSRFLKQDTAPHCRSVRMAYRALLDIRARRVRAGVCSKGGCCDAAYQG